MDFFDAQGSRVTKTNASKHFRSLLERESTAVASLAGAETPADRARAPFSSRVRKAVKQKMSSMLTFFQLFPDTVDVRAAPANDPGAGPITERLQQERAASAPRPS